MTSRRVRIADAGEEALRYRVIAAREFLEKIGIQP
jgi:hypothetical protein